MATTNQQLNKHPPGPWEIVGWPHSSPSIDAGACTVANLVDLSGETKANARLIAAAPLLLSALRSILLTIGPAPETREEEAITRIAEKVIAKATEEKS